MLTTVILTLLMIFAITFVIVIGVGTLPAKVVMKTMPKELQEETKNHPNPPLWKMIIGFTAYAIGIALALFVAIYAGYDAIKQNMGFMEIFIRYMIILCGFKIFDIVVLDWWLITKTQFFQHYFPKTKGSKGYESFGFNKKEQLTQIIAFPIVCAVIAWICTILK